MRELQKQRQRARGVTLEPKGAEDPTDDAESAAAAEAAAAQANSSGAKAHSLESTFTTQAEASEVDPNMLRYIEEKMRESGDGGGPSGSAAAAAAAAAAARSGGGNALEAAEAELYRMPAHLLGAMRGGGGGGVAARQADATEESAQRWLAGITEVSLGAEARMTAIEETERAKRDLMERQLKKQRQREAEAHRDGGHTMVVPGNFNANFHQHRREHAIARREEQGGGGGGAGGGGGGGGGRGGGGGGGGRGRGGHGTADLAGDASAYGRFKANERARR